MTAVDTPFLKLELDIQFRFATKEDLPLLEWYGQYAHFRRMFHTTYEDQEAGKRLMLLADMNRFPVGQIFILLAKPARSLGFPFKPTVKPPNSRRGYLYAFRVIDHLQGMGIGKRLMDEAERLLIEHNHQWATISVAKTNIRALNLYKRLHYRVYSDDPGRWQYVNHKGEIVHVHEPCWVLEKRLKAF